MQTFLCHSPVGNAPPGRRLPPEPPPALQEQFPADGGFHPHGFPAALPFRVGLRPPYAAGSACLPIAEDEAYGI
jgi:hypothetical protein